jgi:hypothetical protein
MKKSGGFEKARVHWHAVANANKLRANGHVALICPNEASLAVAEVEFGPTSTTESEEVLPAARGCVMLEKSPLINSYVGDEEG